MSKKSLPVSALFDALTQSLSNAEILESVLLSKIASNIVCSRVDKEMNQSEFAEFMGVKQSQVSKWENCESSFTIKKLAEIADKLDWNIRLEIERSQKKRTILLDKKTGWASTGNVVPFPGSYEVLKEN